MTGISYPHRFMGRTVLVVEDDPALRALMGQMLGLAGFRPLLAEGLRDALEVAAREPTIDILLTDVRMPEISGIGLASRLREDRPHLPVLFVSGYEVGTIAEAMDFLPKPFSREDLIDAVNHVLERARSNMGAPADSQASSLARESPFIL